MHDVYTVIPRIRMSVTGAMPDPSFRFEVGQCITLTPPSASSVCSASSTHTQCAAHRCGDVSRRLARYSMLLIPPEIDLTIATSSRDSEAWVWMRV